MCSAVGVALAALPAFMSKAAQAADDKQNDQGVASSRMSYSRFLEYLDMGRVRQVSRTLRFCST